MAPFFYHHSDGQPGGFSAELIKEIAQIAKLDIEFRQFPSLNALNQAQSMGRSHLHLATPREPLLANTSIFSTVVATSRKRLFVRVGQKDNQRFINPTNMAIGVLEPISPGSTSDLQARNRIEPMYSIDAMIFKLLSGQIDGFVADETSASVQARRAKLDHRLIAVGPPLDTFDRVIAVHNSQRMITESINAAIAQLENSGELEALRQRYLITMPPSEPNTLLVGVLDFPPYHQMQSDGRATGFAIDVLQAVAGMVDLNLEFKDISIEQWGQGPQPGTYDMLPQVSYTSERSQRMDFALPIERAPFSIFVRADNSLAIDDLPDLRGMRVAVQSVSLVRNLVEQTEGLEPVIVEEMEELLDALLGEQADAVLYLTNPILALAKQRGISEQIKVIEPPFFISERSPTLRLGLGRVRQKLDAAISLYVLSEDFQVVRNKWFGPKLFWTKERIRLAVGVTTLLVLSLIGYLIWQRFQQRQSLDRATLMERYTEKQSQLIQEFERSNDDLEKFAHIASHDLKEPLRGITINADFLKRENLGNQSLQRVNRIVALCQRMEQLISDLLFYSHLNRVDDARKVVDLSQVLDGIRHSIAELLDECNGRIVLNTALPDVYADKSKVRTVFQNLIVNGLKYNDSKHRTIQIGFQKKSDCR